MSVSNPTRTAPDRSAPPDAAADGRDGVRRLSSLFAPCFTLVLRLRGTDAFGEPAALRRRIKSLLDRIEREALRADRAPEALRRAQFGVVAFIDETILASNWDRKEDWMNTPLQLERYDRYDAGEVFFEHLDDALEAPRRHAEVLEVYYLCMTLGFRGKYRIHEQEKRRELIETTAETLVRHLDRADGPLSPKGRPRDRDADGGGIRVPLWGIVVAALLVAAGLYAGLSLSASTSAQQVAESLRRMATG